MRPLLLSLTFLAVTLPGLTAAQADVPDIVVAYPPPNTSVPYDHVIFEGHVSPGATLSVNGRALKVGPDGLFMEWLPLSPGKNALKMLSTLGKQRRAATFNVSFNFPKALPVRPTAIKAGTLMPNRPLNLYTRVPAEGRTVTVRFQGSPGGRAQVTVTGLVTGLGQVALTEQAAGWYQTTLTLPETVALTAAQVKVSLTGQDGKTVVATAPGTLTSAPAGAARVAEITAADVGVGVNPSPSAWVTGEGPSDKLFPRLGQRLRVLGDLGDRNLVQGPGGLATAFKNTLKLLPMRTLLPAAGVGQPTWQDTPSEWQLRLPISQRTPFTLEDVLPSAGKGATLSLLIADAARPAGSLAANEQTPGLTWAPQGEALKLEISLPQVQNWGYFGVYDSGALVLHLRKAPALDPKQPLRGRLIVIDPGHGGSELGGAGSLGEPEKNIVLPIARRVAALLRAQGADARLTRSQDVQVPLYDRPLLAEHLGADLLISLHANALPDGVDPRARRGLEVHTFHPMTWDLAEGLIRSLRRSVPPLQVTALAPLNLPGVRLSDLALARPTSQRSVLIELAYLTQADDLRLLMSEAGREALAEGVAQGIADDYAQQALQTPAWASPEAPPTPQPQPTEPPELLPLPPTPPPDAPLVPFPTPDLAPAPSTLSIPAAPPSRKPDQP